MIAVAHDHVLRWDEKGRDGWKNCVPHPGRVIGGGRRRWKLGVVRSQFATNARKAGLFFAPVDLGGKTQKKKRETMSGWFVAFEEDKRYG